MLNKSLFFLVVLLLAFCGCGDDMISAPEVPEDEDIVLVSPVIDLVSNPSATFKVFRPNMDKVDDPLGAEIFSGTTPYYGLELDLGSYVVRFSAEDYDSKLLGLRLAHGDTNISETVDLVRSPVNPPEYENVSGHLSFSSNPITLGETVGVTPTMYNGALGILSMGGETHFVYSGAYVFPFKPLTAGEHFVSFLAIGEASGDYLPINELLTVLPGDPEEVTLNAWIVGNDTIPADTPVYFGWSASANADSVTTNGYYTDGNIGLSGESHIVIIQDHVLELMVWKDGEIKDTESLEFFVQPPEPMPMPELSFFASAHEVESDNPIWSDHLSSEGDVVFLVWNVTNYDESTDEVSIDRMPTHGNLGPRGLIPVTVSSDTTYTMTVKRSGEEVTAKMTRIFLTQGPIDQPGSISLGWDVDVWVGQRSQDPHEADLMSGIYLPPNVQIAVSARLEYSPASAGQDDEACRIGFLSDLGEHWALNSSGSSTFPDQGEGINQMFYIGTVYDFSDTEGRAVIQSVGGEGKCTNANSVHCSRVELDILLP